MKLIRYFSPDDFILFLQPPPPYSNDLGDAIEALVDQINQIATDNIGAGKIKIMEIITGLSAISDSQGTNPDQESPIPSDSLKRLSASSDDGVASAANPSALVLKANLKFGVPPDAFDQKQELIVQLASVIQANAQSLNSGGAAPAGFQAASPNWYFGGAPGHQPGGGPGGRPVPYSRAGGPASSSAAPRISQPALDILLPALGSIQGFFNVGPQAAEKVTVVILDTAPPRTMLDPNTMTPRKKSVADLASKLQVDYADSLGITGVTAQIHGSSFSLWKIFDYDAPPALTEPVAEEYYGLYGGYLMPDHGLFVAGLIENIAPEANLHLVQVLDDYGLGTYESILRGLQIVEERKIFGKDGNLVGTSRHPLVINMSLCIDFSEEEIAGVHPLLRGTDKNGVSLLDYTLVPMRRLIRRALGEKDDPSLADESLAQQSNSVIVAAAGNEARVGNSPPGARYPAAFDSVLGVAALDKSNARTWYSNRADTQTLMGISVFGGDTSKSATLPRLKATSLVNDSLVSVYSFPTFPDADGKMTINNDTGLAWWSGTSFATAVMSGMMAKLALKGLLLGNRPGKIDINDIVRAMCVLQGITMQGEPKFYVKQEF